MNALIKGLARAGRLFRHRLLELTIGIRHSWRSDIERRISLLKTARQHPEQENLELTIARELVRLSARIKAVEGGAFLYATKAELAAAVVAATAGIESLRLLQEEESSEAGSHRSYIERELSRNTRQTELHCQRIDTGLETVVSRLSEVERLLEAHRHHQEDASRRKD
jgi:hypothetical protein